MRAKARLFEWWEDFENDFMKPTFGGAGVENAWAAVDTDVYEDDADGGADANRRRGDENAEVELTPMPSEESGKDEENLRTGPASDD